MNAKGGKRGVVFGVSFRKTSNDDEENNSNVDDGGNVIEALGALCTEDYNNADNSYHNNSNGVKVAIIMKKAGRIDGEIISLVVAEGSKVGSP
ncbi:hypothetical protein SLA2020_374660 [Shorea laevis]